MTKRERSGIISSSMPKVSTDKKKIERFLTRSVENVYPSKKEVEKMLASGKRLRVYYGIDPTGPTLHLGHMITMKKLAELQSLGHEVILLIGDFTAMIGDPTDKTAVRKQLTKEDVLENCKQYKKQASCILNFGGENPVQLKFNSKWLAKMNFADVVKLASHFTVQQILERDMFESRMKEGRPIHLHEFLYPLMQGQDSVVMDVDGEIGGNDQTFNMLAGRTLQKQINNKEKFVLTNTLLVDPSGIKMGKTEGNMVAMTDTPSDMFGKIMSWPDEMIVQGFTLCTDRETADIEKIEKAMNKGENPMTFKKQLAREVVAWLAGEKEAKSAEKHFGDVFQKHDQPDEIEEVKVGKSISLIDALVKSGLVDSNSDARRQIQQGGVKVDGEVITDHARKLEIKKDGVLLQKGKRHFKQLIP